MLIAFALTHQVGRMHVISAPGPISRFQLDRESDLCWERDKFEANLGTLWTNCIKCICSVFITSLIVGGLRENCCHGLSHNRDFPSLQHMWLPVFFSQTGFTVKGLKIKFRSRGNCLKSRLCWRQAYLQKESLNTGFRDVEVCRVPCYHGSTEG